MSKAPTIREVAVKAGVSVATVSRVLTGSGYADAATRERVLAAADALNYQRNINWSRLKSQSSQTILFLLGNRRTFNSMQMRLLVACEKALHASGYDLVFSRFEYSASLKPADVPLPRLLSQSGAVDGVLLAGVHHSNLLRVLEKRKMPFALLGNSFEGAPADVEHHSVFYDDFGGTQDAVDYLVRLGHRRIAFMGNVSLPWFRRRYEGFVAAMERLGLPAMAATEKWEIGSIDYGQLAVAQLLREASRPTALIGANDEIAAGAWKELMKRGMAIPREMSLIGIGDRAEFAVLEPSLTSVAVFVEEIGERLTRMLLARIEDPKCAPVSESYPCKLVERASCGPLQEVRLLETVKRKLS